MRLPKLDDDTIDVEQTKKMVDLFLDAGFTYFDTAWAYAGSEDAIHQALVEHYPREKFQLATKNTAWINCKTREDATAQFETSLKQTGAGYFDFYLLHNLGEMRTQYFDNFDLWSWVQEKKSQGLIKHVGFSFHSTPEELETILTAHPEMEFVQLQINYADWENPAVQSRACYEVARKHGKPVIIMEPVNGGMLATPPESVEKILKDAEPDASPGILGSSFCGKPGRSAEIISVVHFPVFQKFQFDLRSIRKREPVIVDRSHRISFDLFHCFFYRINGDRNMIIAVFGSDIDIFHLAELDTLAEPAFARWLFSDFSPHMHIKYIFKKFLGVFVGTCTNRGMVDLCHKKSSLIKLEPRRAVSFSI